MKGIRPSRSLAAIALALMAATLLGPTGARGQELAGVALDPEGEPLTGAAVILHRVGGGGGAMAGTDTTGADGTFVFPLPARDSAVYFAALRYEGQIYIGPAVQAGGDPVTGYVLQVSPGSAIEAVGAAVGNPRTPPPTAAQPAGQTGSSSDVGAFLLVSLLAVTAAAAFVFTAPRYRAHRTRETVIEVARLENRLADGELTAEDAQRVRLRRDRLKEQLVPRD